MIENFYVGVGDASDNDTHPDTDWTKARHHGCHYGIIRGATTGEWFNNKPTMRPDRSFPINAEKMAEARLKRLTYGWLDPRFKLCPAVDQADTLLEAIRDYGPGELGLAVDLEDAPRVGIYASIGIGQHVLSYLLALEAAAGCRPRIYTNFDYVTKYLFNSRVREEWLTDYELLIANWGVNAPLVPQPWAPFTWRAWQYRNNAPGAYYGFTNAIPGKTPPNICLAVWNGELA